MPQYEAVDLRTLREARGLTQQQVADYLRIARQAYTNYELRTVKPKKPIMEKLATLFDVNLASIVMYYY